MNTASQIVETVRKSVNGNALQFVTGNGCGDPGVVTAYDLEDDATLSEYEPVEVDDEIVEMIASHCDGKCDAEGLRAWQRVPMNGDGFVDGNTVYWIATWE